MSRAYRLGRYAAEVGADPLGNPHSGLSDDPAERVLARMWRAGYQHGGHVPAGWLDRPSTVPDEL